MVLRHNDKHDIFQICFGRRAEIDSLLHTQASNNKKVGGGGGGVGGRGATSLDLTSYDAGKKEC